MLSVYGFGLESRMMDEIFYVAHNNDIPQYLVVVQSFLSPFL
jgi:hypothetical protein